MTTSLTGALCGLTLGAGLFCLWWSMWETPAQKKSPPAFILRTRDQLRAAGLHRVSPAQLFTVCVGCFRPRCPLPCVLVFSQRSRRIRS